MHKRPVFGHSIEFVQHREYTTGDDIRHLDWKSWSKTDRYYIKQYEAETNLRCDLVDRRQRLDALRPRGAQQVRLRLHRRGLPRLLALPPAGRRVAASPSTRQSAGSSRPRSRMEHMDAIVKAMDVGRPREKTDILGRAPPRHQSIPGSGMVVIISDFLTDREPLLKGLEMLASGGTTSSSSTSSTTRR